MLLGLVFLPSTIGITENQILPLNNPRGGYIQGLIDNASTGDTIYVPSGIYNETIYINKSINLIGEDKNNTIIDGEGEYKTVLYINADMVELQGFTIKNTHSRDEGRNIGINILSNNTIISDNNILSHYGYWMPLDLCIYLIGNNNIIKNNTFSDNNAIVDIRGSNNCFIENIVSHNCWGFLFVGGNYNNFAGNCFSNGSQILGKGVSNNFTENCFSQNGFAIHLYDSKFCIISNNSITNSGAIEFGHPPIHLKNCTNIKICDNELHNNTIGDVNSLMYLENSDNNIIKSNRFIFNDVYIEYCLHLLSSNNNTLSNNIFSSNIIGLSLKHFSNNNTLANNVILHNSKGIDIDFSSNHNSIYLNYIIENDEGITISNSEHNSIENNLFDSNYETGINIDNSTLNKIKNNHISSNGNSIYLKNSTNNFIISNSFIENNRQIKYFEKQKNNFWILNYWNKPRILPKFIFGTINFNNYTIPWFNIDWRPALKPYDIG
jgi:parallel beta-helix repeat protein